MSGPVFLHIGLPKTGTTYLQSLLWNHRDALRGQGILLPGAGPREHLWASCAVREEPRLERRHADAPGAWARLVAELRGWRGTGLVSHEFLCGASPEQVRGAVRDLTEGTGREVHVVVTAREIVALVTARWQEWVKNGATGEIDHYPATDDYVPAEEWGWGTLDLAAVLDRWGSHVPAERIHLICPPETDQPREELWRRFAGVVGIADDGIEPAGAQANESLGLVEVELLRRVNAELRAAGGFRRPVERGVWIRGHLAQRRLAPLGDERFWPGAGRVAELRSRGEAGLERIAARGYDVVGSLDALRTPAHLPDRRHPSEVTDGELVPVAARTIAALLADVRSARAETPVTEPRPPAGLRRWARVWQGGTGRGTRRTDG